MLDLRRKKKETVWAAWSQLFWGQLLGSWQLACFLLRLIILPKALLSLNLGEIQRKQKQPNACLTLDRCVHRMEVAWQCLQHSGFNCFAKIQLIWKLKCLYERRGIIFSVRARQLFTSAECHLRSSRCQKENGKCAAEFLCLAVHQADPVKAQASPVTVKQLMFMTSKSAPLPLPLLIRATCPQGSTEEEKKISTLYL